MRFYSFFLLNGCDVSIDVGIIVFGIGRLKIGFIGIKIKVYNICMV